MVDGTYHGWRTREGHILTIDQKEQISIGNLGANVNLGFFLAITVDEVLYTDRRVNVVDTDGLGVCLCLCLLGFANFQFIF